MYQFQYKNQCAYFCRIILLAFVGFIKTINQNLIQQYNKKLLIAMQAQNELSPKYIRITPSFNAKSLPLELIPADESIQQIQALQIQAVCSACQKWLRNQTIIKTQRENYCVGCFASHLPSCEQYQVINHQAYEIVGDGWTAREQLLLLTAIQKFGFGNWIAVHEYMVYLGAKHTINQIENHFDKYNGKNQQFFQQILNRSPHNPQHDSPIKLPILQKSVKLPHINRGGKKIQKTTCFQLSRLMIPKQQRESLPCFNTKRKQFSIQYNESLEKYIADLEFRDNDSQKEIQLKFKLLENYNYGLKDRAEKHNFILQHKLLDQNYQARQMKYLQLNPYANKAHQILIELKRAMTLDEYSDLRKDLEFCFKIQALIDGLRALRSSNQTCSLKSIGKLDKHFAESAEELGKPKKRVHRGQEYTRNPEQRTILKKLNVSKEQIEKAIQRAEQLNEPVYYKDIKITPLNNLVRR